MSGNLTVGLVPPRLVIDEFKQEEVEIHSLLLMDQNTFEVSHVFQLSPQEHVLSIASCTLTLPDEDKIVYVVGTALVRPEEKEATVGRILIFQANGNKLELLCQKIEEGAVYQVRPFNGKILNSVNSSIYLYKLTDDMNLHQECSYKNNILALYLKTKGDFVLVGDILRSLKLLVYREEEHILEEIAVDHNISPCFCTSIELIDDENYIACDGRHVFICQKNTEAIVEAEMKYMVQPSRMYLGDNINVFSRGSFVMDHPGISSTLLQGKPLLYGTVHGAIGLIGQLNNDTYSILSALQQKMVASIKSVGNIEHEIYRSFSNEHRSKPYAGFIDGDLIEKFLDLPRMEMLELSKGIKMIDVQGMEVDATVDDVLKLIEDLSRLH
jgi:DNA damage-binding protein 1